ncbi:MAG: hypothetical protein K9J16_08150 [Melioribacteraceae bacterium]|nr:hypothetical protein [Melioribacteraceae bacterium]MCF8353874.1 hypothetical protein [Melioribacteraceae bacterium]MCF8393107.1 hypothetical protein [Melioribacteraceae bacterium]MCF8419226.1 hypothetical protein [Melioribacteraceae bacterium]
MGGKASILLVLGFSMIFLVIGYNYNNINISAIDNVSEYYIRTNAHNIALSGANMAANEVFMEPTWESGYSSLTINGGTVNVYVSNPNFGSGKITICHVPPGNPANRHEITIPPSALPAHLAHGDYLGSCAGGPVDDKLVTIISEGTFQGVTEVVVVELRPSYFSKFGNFYSSVSALPATGDTFHGPFHTQGKLSTWGSPVFLGKVTSQKGLTMHGSPKDPKFYGGFETGIDVPLQFDTSGFRSNAGKIFKDTTGTDKKVDVRLYFNGDGTVDWSQKIGNGAWSAVKTTPLSTLAPTGLIYINKGNLYTKGTVNGAVTVVVTKENKSGCGNIYQEDDIQYVDDPRSNPNSDDLLGLVAEEDIRLVFDPTLTQGQDIITQASMYALNGDIGPDNALIQDPSLNSWRILGGLIASTTRVTAEYNAFGPTNGYRFIHNYDQRFMTIGPPFFPNTKDYEVVSWLE